MELPFTIKHRVMSKYDWLLEYTQDYEKYRMFLCKVVEITPGRNTIII